jgi:3-hydroxyacyl-[acyl-carrier protein] dehydratase/trans-2-decenoyl-[acyl-carrier protein] isomerase
MKYEEFRRRSRFQRRELLAFADGALLQDAPAGFHSRLPQPPMLMIDRIDAIERTGSRGHIVASSDVDPGQWFFDCHFAGDPVQPGCLGVDAVWQLLGFFCAWSGGLGRGRALGCGEIEFTGQILPTARQVRYEVDVRRFARMGDGWIALGDATVFADDEAVYSLRGARSGLFAGIEAVEVANSTPRAAVASAKDVSR